MWENLTKNVPEPGSEKNSSYSCATDTNQWIILTNVLVESCGIPLELDFYKFGTKEVASFVASENIPFHHSL
jgi:hypothetical protein